MIRQEIIYIMEEEEHSKKEVVNQYNLLIDEIGSIETLTHENMPNKFTQAILKECDKDTLLIKDAFDELKEIFNNNPLRFIDSMRDILDTYCYKEQICSNCGEELEFTYQDEPSIYFGREVYEPISESRCPNGCCIK